MIAILISSISIIISIISLALSIEGIKACKESDDDIATVVNQSKLDRRVLEGLRQCHEKNTPECCWSWGEYTIYRHIENKACTSTTNDVTLEELAKLVLDGTPIKRDVPEPKEYGMHKIK